MGHGKAGLSGAPVLTGVGGVVTVKGCFSLAAWLCIGCAERACTREDNDLRVLCVCCVLHSSCGGATGARC